MKHLLLRLLPFFVALRLLAGSDDPALPATAVRFSRQDAALQSLYDAAERKEAGEHRRR